MKITNGKDFWAGVMFVAFGLAFLVIAIGPNQVLVDAAAKLFNYKLEYGYAMGTSVRMGPAYFPAVLGGMLAVLGGVVLFRGFVSRLPNPVRVFPFKWWRFVAGIVLGILAYYTQPGHDASLWWDAGHTILSGLAVGLLFAAFGEKSLWIILFSVVIFGYLLKPLGLVAATILLVAVSAWGGHEFRWKEVTILSVALAVFSVFSFVKGLGLPMNIWPGIWE